MANIKLKAFTPDEYTAYKLPANTILVQARCGKWGNEYLIDTNSKKEALEIAEIIMHEQLKRKAQA